MSTLQEDLYEAIENGELNKVRQLLKKGADPNRPDEFGQSPLNKALNGYRNDSEKIALLLIKQGADVNALNEDGEPDLGEACGKSVNVLAAMLKAGADPNLGVDEGHAPIFKAVGFDFQELYTKSFKLLVKAGAKLLVKDESGSGLLRKVAQYGNVEFCKILIDAGYPVDGLDGDFAPLYGAIVSGNAACVQYLIEQGATIDKPLSRGDGLPIKFAKSFGKDHREVVAVLQAALGQTPQPKKKKPTPAAPKKARSKADGPKDIPSAWKLIEAWLKDNAPETRKSLNRKATDKQLTSAQKTMGFKFPKELKAFYQAHNGQKASGLCLVPGDRVSDVGYLLTSLNEGIEEWKSWRELIDIGEFKDEKAEVSKGIRSKIWHEGWLPIASNGAGDSLCIDLDPTKAGKVGQVLSFCHESNERKIVSNSLTDWLIGILNALESGEWEPE